MCGIFGWVAHDRPLTADDVECARRSTRQLAHRGPDHQGEWLDTHVFMGHRRLSVIDLTAAANQPFMDPTGRYVFAFNGEIYNYLELRVELEGEGCRFQTSSDTEVFLAALITWGTRALTRVDGMFAAALHDRATGEHLLVRDPLGQKPLYYAPLADGVVYASELRSLLSLPGHRWSIDRAAFLRYLMLGYYGLDETPIAGIRKLLPGCVARSTRSGTIIERYWDSIPGADPHDLSMPEALDRFDTLFGESCARSMRADVPYGVFLSGGLDSSLVASFCRDTQPSLHTISVAMSERDYDESAKAELVSSHLGISNHRRVTMSDESVQEAMRLVFDSSDEPHADPGYVNAFFLARAARQDMVVALAGDGGDELFAGYPPFGALGLESVFRFCPAPIVAACRALARQLPASDRYLGLQFKALAFLQGFPGRDAVRYPLWLSSVGVEELGRIARGSDALLSRPGDAASLFGSVRSMLATVGALPADRLLYYYQKSFLPEFVCMHTDRAAMQASLEVRSPFLSLPLIEFANRLPLRLKSHRGQLKVLLRRAAARRGLPASIVEQSKQGFTFPLARWLKTTLRPQVEALAAPGGCDERLLDPMAVRQYVDEHLSGRRNNYRILYNLMVFGAWQQHYPGLEVA